MIPTRVSVQARHVAEGYMVRHRNRPKTVLQIDENPEELIITFEDETIDRGEPEREMIVMNIAVPAHIAGVALNIPIGTLLALVADGLICRDQYNEFYPSEIERYRKEAKI